MRRRARLRDGARRRVARRGGALEPPTPCLARAANPSYGRCSTSFVANYWYVSNVRQRLLLRSARSGANRAATAAMLMHSDSKTLANYFARRIALPRRPKEVKPGERKPLAIPKAWLRAGQHTLHKLSVLCTKQAKISIRCSLVAAQTHSTRRTSLRKQLGHAVVVAASP